ncbi:tyrosine-type recombinase/integrase [Planotetraspora sp. A-T 1434]|uniref:tyrosine-type recombinase/integrase n=1 Tax=Planotetraspora sp. A-T 1434 TaxID=2979219 RepID=UPI0039659416
MNLGERFSTSRSSAGCRSAVLGGSGIRRALLVLALIPVLAGCWCGQVVRRRCRCRPPRPGRRRWCAPRARSPAAFSVSWPIDRQLIRLVPGLGQVVGVSSVIPHPPRDEPDEGARTRFHDLRHFYASSLFRANLNPKVIQACLGHATIAETMDTYGPLFPDDESRQRSRRNHDRCSADGTAPEQRHLTRT